MIEILKEKLFGSQMKQTGSTTDKKKTKQKTKKGTRQWISAHTAGSSPCLHPF